MARNGSHKLKSAKNKSPVVDWKIVGRVHGQRMELVQVPIHPAKNGVVHEKVIQIIRGPSLETALRGKGKRSQGLARKDKKQSKKAGRKTRHLGMLSDRTGQIALKTFRLAVRQAKRQ